MRKIRCYVFFHRVGGTRSTPRRKAGDLRAGRVVAGAICRRGIFIQEGVAFVYFLYMGSGRIFGCELCRRRGRGGVGASSASLRWVWSFCARISWLWRNWRENIKGDMECGGTHNLSLIGFRYFIVFVFLFYFLLFHDISPCYLWAWLTISHIAFPVCMEVRGDTMGV